MPKPADKSIIAVDVDDVLALNAQAFVDFSNQRWGTNLSVNDYSDHWVDLWKVNEHEGKRRVDEYLGSGSFSEYLSVAGAHNILKRLKKDHKLVVLTARQKSLSQETNAWLQKHFSDVFDEIHFAGVWDKPLAEAVKLDKTEVAKQIGADYLVEDQLKYALPAAKAGIKVLLFGEYPWNQINKLPAGITRVKDWQEVLEHFSEKG